MTQLYNQIPVLDLSDFEEGNESVKEKFTKDLGQAFEEIGFVAIKGHGLTDATQNGLYTAIKEFFTLSDELKEEYELPELFGQRGYVGKRKEHAKGRNVGDLKEFYHIGQEAPQNDPVHSDYPVNIWPKEVPSFAEFAMQTYRTLEKTGQIMMRAIALHLGLDENHFDHNLSFGNSILRPIHYFPLNAEDLKENAVRAAEHGDINLITLLMGASAEGLEVQRKDGAWIPITALPDQIIVNVGDMLERHTNDQLKSTIHRVVNPKGTKLGEPRFSIPFFMHPRMSMDLSCLQNCVDATKPKKYKDITAGQFLQQRLEEIGLKK